MSEEMSKKEIINILSDEIVSLNVGHKKYEQAVKGLLDLYQKQKEKNIDAILDCMEEVNQELMDDLLHGRPHRKPAREKIKRLEEELKKEKEKNKESNKENTIINRRLENAENNYTQLIEDVSTLAIALELQEDATIDEMYEEIKNLQEECKETVLEAQKYFDKYEEEKEKNKELQSYMKTNLIPKNTINLLYISKDKIREKIEWLKNNILENDYANSNDQDIAEYQVDVLVELLEENNAKQM